MRTWMLLMCLVFAATAGPVRTYRSLPALPQPVVLDDWRFSIVRPVGRTNLILNPSVETNTTGYTASGASIARSTTYAYHGAYSLAITPTAATTDGVYYTTSALVSGSTYGISVKVKGDAGRPYRVAVASNAGTVIQTQAFIGTGFWQWVTLLHTATASATHRIYIAKNGGTQTSIFYMDGLQLELCAANEYFVTTYIDGDQLGLLGAVELPPFYWTGTPHASTSVRSGQTRAGGRVIPLSNYGYVVTNVQGLGMAPVQQITTPFAQLDGSQYLDTRKTDRGVTFSGRWLTRTPYDRQRKMAALMADLDRDLIATRQPLTILAEPLVDSKPIRAPLFIPALSYVDGLSGNLDGLPTGESIIAFTQYQPRINGGDSGSALTALSTPVASAVYQRNPSGQWAGTVNASDGGYPGVIVRTLAMGQSGILYAGGSFTTLAITGTTVNRVAQFNGSAWAAMGTGMDAIVRSMAIAPNGNVYATGDFTTADGGAAARVAMWNGTAWSALGSGLGAGGNAVAVAPNGDLYVGGAFTTAGGGAANRIARWNGSAWSALGSGLDGSVAALAFGLDGTLYVGGGFTTAGGGAAVSIARWNPATSTWSALGAGTNGTVNALAVAPNGMLYAGGTFTTAGGITANYVAMWNGVQWSALGPGLAGAGLVASLAVNPRTNILYAGGTFATAAGLTSAGFAQWNGSAWTRADVLISGTTDVYAILPRNDGTIFIGRAGTTTTSAAGITTITVGGSALGKPVVTITGPTAATALMVQLLNITSGAAIYLNTTMSVGETITIDLRRAAITSSFRGNILSDVLSGSDLAEWFVQPGANTISFYAQDASVTATMYWANDLASLEDGWTK